MLKILYIVAGWFTREVLVKFVVMAAIFAAVAALGPLIGQLVSSFVGVTALTNAFTGIPPGVWYFWDLMRLAFGLPLIIAASVARFTIRRLPFVG